MTASPGGLMTPSEASSPWSAPRGRGGRTGSEVPRQEVPCAAGAARPRRALGAMAGAVALALVVTLALAGCGGGSTQASPTVVASLTPTVEDGVQVFNVVGLRSLEFSATELLAAPGRIRVNFSVEKQSAPHNFVVPEIPAAKTAILSAGASESITFTAGERGSYQVICTLHPNMLATLKIA